MKRILIALFLLVSGASSARAADAPQLSIADATIIESNSRFRELLVPVTLSSAQTFDVTASFKTKDISAVANADYTPQLAGQIVIKAGQTRANILVRVVGDTVEEKDESFLVQLGAPKRATISDSDGIVSIYDNDYNGQISISDTSVTEINSGVKIAKLEIKFSPTPLHAIVVDYETKDDSAKMWDAYTSDYTTARGRVLFRPGREVALIPVKILGDTLVEGTERCLMKIGAGGIPIAKSVGFITILDDDALLPPLSGKIAFVSYLDGKGEIYVMNADGTNRTRLTTNTTEDYSPSFSSDGSKITFVSYRDGNHEIYVMNADGTDPIRITNSPSYDFDPCFSGDGSKIAFVSNRAGNREIFVMNADGTNPIRLTSSDVFDYMPCFSPDGSKIVFMSDRYGSYELSVVNADGTSPPQPKFFGWGSYPCFSPDGSKIVYVNDDEIYIMNADGTNRTRLTNNTAENSYPCFSPDGSQIAFAFYRDRNRETYVMNADGTSQTRLTASTRYDRASSWAPGSVPAPPAATPAVPSYPSAPAS